jgi:hypothetical protein
MKALLILSIALLILACSPQQAQQPYTAPVPQVQPPPAPPALTEPTPPILTAPPEQQNELVCGTDLQPQQITQIRTSLQDKGLEKDTEGFSFRVLPVDSTGTKVIPAEGSITVTLFSSREDKPLLSEYSVYKKSVYVKPSDLMSDCGPKPVVIKWSDIQASQNYRYLKTPNPGILLIQYTRTGSQQLFEYEYRGAEHNVFLIT